MSISKEDYIKTIYELGGEKNQVNNKDIAKVLNISAPSVSEMVRKLLDDGYVEYVQYQGVRLTDYGVSEAMKIRRRHLLWEVFLVQKLGYSWDEVDEEAERLEHVTSLQLEKRLDKYLNYPAVCPHGTPILKDRENLSQFKTLDKLSIGDETTIRRLIDKKEILKYADSLGLNIGEGLKIIDIDTLNGKIKIKMREQELIVTIESAKNIYVD